MRLLSYLLIMAVVYFVVPIAWPTVDITITQAAAITFLVQVVRVTVFEDITVKLHGVEDIRIEEQERD